MCLFIHGNLNHTIIITTANHSGIESNSPTTTPRVNGTLVMAR
jgi:hypothetical protein